MLPFGQNASCTIVSDAALSVVSPSSANSACSSIRIGGVISHCSGNVKFVTALGASVGITYRFFLPSCVSTIATFVSLTGSRFSIAASTVARFPSVATTSFNATSFHWLCISTSFTSAIHPFPGLLPRLHCWNAIPPFAASEMNTRILPCPPNTPVRGYLTSFKSRGTSLV